MAAMASDRIRTLPELMQTLPQELFDEVYNLTVCKAKGRSLIPHARDMY